MYFQNWRQEYTWWDFPSFASFVFLGDFGIAEEPSPMRPDLHCLSQRIYTRLLSKRIFFFLQHADCGKWALYMNVDELRLIIIADASIPDRLITMTVMKFRLEAMWHWGLLSLLFWGGSWRRTSSCFFFQFVLPDFTCVRRMQNLMK